MRSSSFVFMFILGHNFRNCVKIELYCVLVVGPKNKKQTQCSSSGRKFVPILECFSGPGVLPYSRRLKFHHLNTRC